MTTGEPVPAATVRAARTSPSAARAMRVLEAIAADPARALTLAQLQRELGFSHGNLHAILSSLEAAGHVRRDPRSKAYTLGPALLAIGDAARLTYPGVERATPLLDKLAAQLDTEVQAAMRVGDELLVVARVGPIPPVGFGAVVGERAPLRPPVGTAFMAWSTPQEIDHYLSLAAADLDPQLIERHRAVLADVRHRGYSILVDSTARSQLSEAALAIVAAGSRREYREYKERLERITVELSRLPDAADVSAGEVAVDVGDVVGLGSPVFGADGSPEMIVMVAFVAPRMARIPIAEAAAQLMETARAITTVMGGRQPL